MGYYSYKPAANDFAGIGFSIADDQRIVDVHFTDRPLAEQWVAPVAHGFDDNPDTDGDFPSLSNFYRIPVMSERAWQLLRPIIGHCCETLPIIHPSGLACSIVHVMETIDCLDSDRSELEHFSDGGIMRIVRYALREEMLRGKHIFKLPRKNTSELIVDDEFRNAVEINGLQGLKFQELPMAG